MPTPTDALADLMAALQAYCPPSLGLAAPQARLPGGDSAEGERGGVEAFPRSGPKFPETAPLTIDDG